MSVILLGQVRASVDCVLLIVLFIILMLLFMIYYRWSETYEAMELAVVIYSAVCKCNNIEGLFHKNKIWTGRTALVVVILFPTKGRIHE